MRREVTAIRRWHLLLPYCLLGVAFVIGGFGITHEQDARRHDAVHESKTRAAAICEAENQTRGAGVEYINQNRAAIRGLIDRAFAAAPQPLSPGAQAFLDDAHRTLVPVVFTPVACSQIVNHPTTTKGPSQ